MHLEHYEPQASWRSSMWMFVAGAAIGAATALMMAPATGRESREYLRRQGRKVASDMGAQADKLASAVKWGQEQASSAVRSTVDSAKAALSAAKSLHVGEPDPPGTGATRPMPRPMTSSPA